MKKYTYYALGEILLVMIGILLALQVNKWNDQRLDRIEELKYYSNLKGDLLQQREDVNGQITYNERHREMFAYALQVSVSGDLTQQDTIMATIPYLFNYSDYDHGGNLYETLVNSGDISLLENEEIIKGIRGIEGRYSYINRMENIHWEVIIDYVSSWATSKIKFAELKAVDQEDLYSFEFHNMLILLERIMEEKTMIYNTTIREIDLLIQKLDAEIAEDH